MGCAEKSFNDLESSHFAGLPSAKC